MRLSRLRVVSLSIGDGFLRKKETDGKEVLLVHCGRSCPEEITIPTECGIHLVQVSTSQELDKVLHLEGPNLQALGNFIAKIVRLRPAVKNRYRRKGFIRCNPDDVKNPTLPPLRKQKK